MATCGRISITVELPKHLAALIPEQVASGRYADTGEVVGEALRLLDERDRLAWMRARVAEGLEEIERGDTVPYSRDLMELLKREAEEDVRNGVPDDDAVAF
jgi:antitoxin ParD1/3/4